MAVISRHLAGLQRQWRNQRSCVELGSGLACAALIGLGCAPELGENRTVRPGIEVLLADSAHLVEGQRVGLLANQTAVDRDRVSAVDLLVDAGVQLTTLFSPEHGFRGTLNEENIGHGTDTATGLPIFSLYGERRAPTAEMLETIDLLLVDLQDVGARPYTYISTVLHTMRVAAPTGVTVVVLDRPNPIGGELVQGPVLDLDHSSFVGMLPLPLRHGMTLGELALFGNEVLDIGASLIVVPADGWRRHLWFDGTGLPWVRPSPSMPDLESASHYPGIVLFEGTNLSVGRGTPLAFQVVGAPWLEPREILTMVGDEPAVEITDTVVTPLSPPDGKFADTPVQALRFRVIDRTQYDPIRLAVRLLFAIRSVHPDSFQVHAPEHLDRLAGSDRLRLLIASGESPDHFFASWEPALAEFRRTREPFLLYR